MEMLLNLLQKKLRVSLSSNIVVFNENRYQKKWYSTLQNYGFFAIYRAIVEYLSLWKLSNDTILGNIETHDFQGYFCFWKSNNKETGLMIFDTWQKCQKCGYASTIFLLSTYFVLGPRHITFIWIAWLKAIFCFKVSEWLPCVLLCGHNWMYFKHDILMD